MQSSNSEVTYFKYTLNYLLYSLSREGDWVDEVAKAWTLAQEPQSTVNYKWT